jgi:hypothetical protein
MQKHIVRIVFLDVCYGVGCVTAREVKSLIYTRCNNLRGVRGNLLL